MKNGFDSVKSLHKAVFLDRDGTINKEVGYLSRIEDLVIIDMAGKAIRLLNQHGYKVAVVTNQSGVARGLFGESDVCAIHEEISRRLLTEGAVIDRWYYCPHHPSEGLGTFKIECSCRKPLPGMLERARDELEVELSGSFVIGDSIRDMELAWNAGANAVLVLTGYGEETMGRLTKAQIAGIAYIAADIFDACKWICSR
ncbi:MAG: D-glycero-beta-D-manno-heptose 1,7-bisphosphate 7-phosphatase [Dissulfurimicrobium sp.]|uniref:D-glycero-beta-D-manno-heptose 1,7-bisphosphate 7-phosphatase n=1 Tax=Dissulfurimicrobium sp. TaxID=2022436 RepID=UPI0040495309